jgi:hypothetical protein
MSGDLAALDGVEARPGDSPPPLPPGDTPWWRRIRWHSTPESADAGKPSALAIFETLGAVATYSWVAMRYGTLHLTIAACVAPVLLLRTRESIRRGLRYAERYFREPQGAKVLRVSGILLTAAVILMVVASFGVFYSTASSDHNIDEVVELNEAAEVAVRRVFGDLLFDLFGWPLYAVILSVFWIATYGPLISVVTAGLLLIRPMAYRVVATFACFIERPRPTVATIPSNWYRQVFCIDSFHPPEVLPGAIFEESARNSVPTHS